MANVIQNIHTETHPPNQLKNTQGIKLDKDINEIDATKIFPDNFSLSGKDVMSCDPSKILDFLDDINDKVIYDENTIQSNILEAV